MAGDSKGFAVYFDVRKQMYDTLTKVANPELAGKVIAEHLGAMAQVMAKDAFCKSQGENYIKTTLTLEQNRALNYAKAHVLKNYLVSTLGYGADGTIPLLGSAAKGVAKQNFNKDELEKIGKSIYEGIKKGMGGGEEKK